MHAVSVCIKTRAGHDGYTNIHSTSNWIKTPRTCKPQHWVTSIGALCKSSPACRRWVNGETVEVLHACMIPLAKACVNTIVGLTIYYWQWLWLSDDCDFIFMDISTTFWLCIWLIGILELISSDTHEYFICWLLKMWSVIFMWWFFFVPPRWVDKQRNFREYLPPGVGSVLTGKPLKFCMCFASTRLCSNVMNMIAGLTIDFKHHLKVNITLF